MGFPSAAVLAVPGTGGITVAVMVLVAGRRVVTTVATLVTSLEIVIIEEAVIVIMVVVLSVASPGILQGTVREPIMAGGVAAATVLALTAEGMDTWLGIVVMMVETAITVEVMGTWLEIVLVLGEVVLAGLVVAVVLAVVDASIVERKVILLGIALTTPD